MNHAEIRDLLGYTEWATARLVEALHALPDAARRRRDDSAFGSVHGTLTHLIAAEWVWLERWQGRSPATPPPWVGDARFDELRARLEAIEVARAGYVQGLAAHALDAPIPYRLFNGQESASPIGPLVRHVVNHSSYHRGQLAMRIRQLGDQPPATDYIVWHRFPAPRPSRYSA